MTDERPWYEETVLPVLLRFARPVYGDAIREELREVGCDDLPRNGSFVIGAIARNGTPLGEVIRGLQISKQAASQLVDTLVLRGYLERSPDPEDRRRMTVSLTERGQLAAEAGRRGVESVEQRLEELVGTEQLRVTRATLAALIGLREHGHAHEEVD